MVIAWIVIGVALAAFELHHLAFFALFGAVGAFAAAGVALVAPGAIGVQALVAVVVAALGIVAARPYVSRIIHRRGDGYVVRGVHGGFVGAHTTTVDVVSNEVRPGHVRLAGEQWLAVSGDGQPIPAGTEVVVTAVAGTTLTVWPANPIPGAPLLIDPTVIDPTGEIESSTTNPTNEVT